MPKKSKEFQEINIEKKCESCCWGWNDFSSAHSNCEHTDPSWRDHIWVTSASFVRKTMKQWRNPTVFCCFSSGLSKQILWALCQMDEWVKHSLMVIGYFPSWCVMWEHFVAALPVSERRDRKDWVTFLKEIKKKNNNSWDAVRLELRRVSPPQRLRC